MHAIAILLMSRLPLDLRVTTMPALAGLLIVTAWLMEPTLTMV